MVERQNRPAVQWFIYALRDPRDNEVRYIGRTRYPRIRLKAHLSEARCAKETRATHKDNWLRGLLSVGLEPVIEILEQGSGDWATAERKWVAGFREAGNSLVNRTDGGDGVLGLVALPQTRVRQSASAHARLSRPDQREHAEAALRKARAVQAQKRRDDPEWNRWRSEQVAATRVRNGKQWSQEARDWCSQRQIGTRLSPEHRAKIGAACKLWWENAENRAGASAKKMLATLRQGNRKGASNA